MNGKVNPLITITVGVRGAIHEHPTDKLMKLHIPQKQHDAPHEIHPPNYYQISHISNSK